ncbi:MAG: response regulator [Candidatus Manganitrophus sp. SA1]|nr:response regulator [Candidatus Manganitrophus morganii]
MKQAKFIQALKNKEVKVTSKKILVVDDDPDAVNIVTTILKIAGYSVISAKDGLDAMEKIRCEHPALILLDIMMPRMDGFEVCKAIKKNPKFSHIPVSIISAKMDPVSKKRAMMLGVRDYITKPIHPAEALRKNRNA